MLYVCTFAISKEVIKRKMKCCCDVEAMNPDVYQGWWGGKHCRDSPVQTDRECDCEPDKCQAGENYYTEFEQVFRYSLPRGKVAGFIAESIQVCADVEYNAVHNIRCIVLQSPCQ